MQKSRIEFLIFGMLLSTYCGHVFAATAVNFYAKDQHGSIVGAADANGNLTATALNQYNDYGVNQSISNHRGQIKINYDPYQYSGEYTDEESGLQPLGNGYRYYDPSLMRFISPDSYPLLNLYAYGNGNPIGNVDPSGHIGIGIMMGVLGVIGMFMPGVDDGPAEAAIVEGSIQMGENVVENEATADAVTRVGESRSVAAHLAEETPEDRANIALARMYMTPEDQVVDRINKDLPFELQEHILSYFRNSAGRNPLTKVWYEATDEEENLELVAQKTRVAEFQYQHYCEGGLHQQFAPEDELTLEHTLRNAQFIQQTLRNTQFIQQEEGRLAQNFYQAAAREAHLRFVQLGGQENYINALEAERDFTAYQYATESDAEAQAKIEQKLEQINTKLLEVQEEM